jgi:TonB-linked SusC/RagA family outer membrane protein
MKAESFFRNKRRQCLQRAMLLSMCLLLAPAYSEAQAGDGTTSGESVHQQDGITGYVYDEAGSPIAGATVIVRKVAGKGTMTDDDGKFTLAVAVNAGLEISCIGFRTRRMKAVNNMKVTLKENSEALDEVVVVGYGTQKKINLSGSVQTISSRKLADRPVANVNQALQGLAANMNITQTTGRATSAPDINIRGFTSINGGGALILIDNVPISPDELSRINPEDIESVSILKDAASTAIYGGRASFGVVLITTKQAHSKGLQVAFEGSAGVRALGYVPDLITDVYEVMSLQNPASTRNPLFSAEEMEYGRLRSEHPELYPAIVINNRQGLYSAGNWAYWDNVDWNATFLRPMSPSYSGNLRIADRNDRMHYTLSGGYCRTNGVMRYGNDIYDRFNLRVNGGYNLSRWWEAGANISFNYSNYDMPEAGNDKYFFYVSRSALRSLYNPDGTYTVAGAYLIGLPTEGGRSISQNNETQLTLNTVVDLIKDVWNIKADANFRFTNGQTRGSHFPVYYREGPNGPLVSSLTDGGDNTYRHSTYATTASSLKACNVYNVYTDFHKTFAGKHYVQVLLGFNQESMTYTSSFVHRNDLISQSLPSIQLATGTTVSAESIATLALRSGFGRLNYTYDDKYIVEFNSRYDGASRYASKNRFGFFPSGSLAWVLSEESFLTGAMLALRIDRFKLRGSYGALGNQIMKDANGGDIYYPYIATMGAANISVPVNGSMPTATFQPGAVADNLTWERVRTVNGGFDLALFDNRIALNVDVYTRYTEGMLVQGKALPSVFGTAPPRINAGNLKTKGWEIVLGLNHTWHAAGSPLYVGLNLMLSDSRSFVTKYDNPTKGISDAAEGNANYYEGQEIGEMWGWVSDGFLTKDDLILHEDGTPTGNAKIDQYDVSEEDNRSTGVSYEGDIKFKDLNGDGRITYGKSTVDDPGDRRIIGNDRIRLPYSFELNVTWKGFDLRAFFQGVGKRDWYAGHNHHDFWGVYGNPWATPIAANRDHWTPENPNARWPRLKPYIAENKELALPQTGYLQNAAYLRLKNLTIGYTLPASLTQWLHIDKLRFYFSAENAFTFHHIEVSGVDPELLTGSGEGVYPLHKTYSLGLNLNF